MFTFTFQLPEFVLRTQAGVALLLQVRRIVAEGVQHVAQSARHAHDAHQAQKGQQIEGVTHETCDFGAAEDEGGERTRHTRARAAHDHHQSVRYLHRTTYGSEY